MVRKTLGASMNQYHLIKLVPNAQLKVTKKDWFNSFIRVNMHLKFRLPFNEWIMKLEDNGVLESGKKFLKEKGRYDSMPAFWRFMPMESFHYFVAAVDNLYANKTEGSHDPVWSKSNVPTLIIFFRLEDLSKGRSCCLTVKRDPLLLCTTEEEHVSNMAECLKSAQKDPAVDDFFSFLPQKLIYKFNADKADEAFVGPFNKRQHKNLFKNESQKQLFSHICNYSAQMHWDDDEDLVPSGFLNVDVTKSQHRLLNLTFNNVLTGLIMYDVNGEVEKKNLSRRRLDAIEGNIDSYSRCLNSSKRMEAMKDHHKLAAAVADIYAEQAQDKENCKKEEFNKYNAKEYKKRKDTAEFDMKRTAVMPSLSTATAKFSNGEATVPKDFDKMNNGTLVDNISSS